MTAAGNGGCGLWSSGNCSKERPEPGDGDQERAPWSSTKTSSRERMGLLVKPRLENYRSPQKSKGFRGFTLRYSRNTHQLSNEILMRLHRCTHFRKISVAVIDLLHIGS